MSLFWPQRETGGGAEAQTQSGNLDLLLYRVRVRPAPLRTFEYDGWFQEGLGEKADVAPWRAVYWRRGDIGATRITRLPQSDHWIHVNRCVNRCVDALKSF